MEHTKRRLTALLLLHSMANTWEYKTITVSGGLITAGTWNWTSGVGLSVHFTLAAGSTYQTTANAWQTGNFLATANQVNCLDTVNNIFAITGVQLEVGSVATPFEHRPYGVELALCQRYYEVGWLEYDGYALASSGVGSSGGVFKQTKRATPTMGYVPFTNFFNTASVADRSVELEGVWRFASPTAGGAHLRARQLFNASAEL